MNYFVEGLQGSGKSTLVRYFSQHHPECIAVREGDYSPVELAWCAYVEEKEYQTILDRYPEIRSEIVAKTFTEGTKKVICYTQILTDVSGFHRDLEHYEIYNGRISLEDFKSIVLGRYRRWTGDRMIFECSLFQNIVEDLILFRCLPDEEILPFYQEIRKALESKEYQILYLKTEDIEGNLKVIRKERSDLAGNELWFPMMLQYFEESPYAKANDLHGEEALIRHFAHRQELELKICEDVFPEKCTVLVSKQYENIF